MLRDNMRTSLEPSDFQHALSVPFQRWFIYGSLFEISFSVQAKSTAACTAKTLSCFRSHRLADGREKKICIYYAISSKKGSFSCQVDQAACNEIEETYNCMFCICAANWDHHFAGGEKLAHSNTLNVKLHETLKKRRYRTNFAVFCL